MASGGEFIADRVIWSEGMLVSPQHLQQQAVYNERALNFRLSALSPYAWGVLRVELDTNSLIADQLVVDAFAGVLPDGSSLCFSKGQRGVPLPRAISPSFPATQRVLQVHLGIAREREGIANVAESVEERQMVRYEQINRDVADLVSGREARVLVSFGRPHVVVLFGDEANQDYDSIQIAELVRDAAGTLVVSDSYIPPCLQIGASPVLMASLQSVFGLAVARQRALSETCRERSGSTLEFQSSDITAFLQQSALNAMLPVLQHLLDAPRISPWSTYLLLSQLAGQLSTFATDADPTSLPKFNHTDLGTTYKLLFDRLTQLLSGTVIKRYLSLPLKKYPNGVMLAELEDPRLVDCRTYVLTAKSERNEAAPERLAIDLPKLSKIGSKTTIKSIVQAAANGVPMQVAHRVPSEIPVREGVVYFILDVEDPAWKAVLNERNLALFMPPPYDPGRVRYELLAIPEE